MPTRDGEIIGTFGVMGDGGVLMVCCGGGFVVLVPLYRNVLTRCALGNGAALSMF
jgi:hypothetical protein